MVPICLLMSPLLSTISCWVSPTGIHPKTGSYTCPACSASTTGVDGTGVFSAGVVSGALGFVVSAVSWGSGSSSSSKTAPSGACSGFPPSVPVRALLSERMAVEPESSSLMSTCVWSSAVPSTWIGPSGRFSGRSTSVPAFSFQVSVAVSVWTEEGINSASGSLVKK